MYSVLLDTNVLLDYLSADRAEHEVTVQALRACMLRDDVRIFVPACLLKDVYFVYERHYGSEADARRKIALMRRAFEVVELTLDIVDAALASDEPDFEDGLVRATAETLGVDAIVSRDARAYANSAVGRLSAAELLERAGARGGFLDAGPAEDVPATA